MPDIDMRAARAALGEMWSLGRPLKASEMGRLLGLKGRDPGAQVLKWERGEPITGPVRVAVEMMLDGAIPRSASQLISR